MTTVGAGNGIDDRYLIAYYFIALVRCQDFPKAGVAAPVELGFCWGIPSQGVPSGLSWESGHVTLPCRVLYTNPGKYASLLHAQEECLS